ncbi:FHA domain-containing protein [bacterium]|nr:FHA domain-containing protein [bacterium]
MSTTKMCPNGHVMEATWDRCPYCPDPSRMGGRGPIPPTRMSNAPDLPSPTPAPKPAVNKKTVVLQESQKVPVVGWLVALTGKHKGDDFRVKEGKNIVGSDPDCDVILTDEFISSKHANLKYVNKDGERIFIITDLDSTNGTFLNDAEEPIAREELVDNDTITFGQTKMKFKCL